MHPTRSGIHNKTLTPRNTAQVRRLAGLGRMVVGDGFEPSNS